MVSSKKAKISKKIKAKLKLQKVHKKNTPLDYAPLDKVYLRALSETLSEWYSEQNDDLC